MRPNTRGGLSLTARVLVPAVRRSLALRGSGGAAARALGTKEIVPAMATPDASMICRRVRSVGLSFSLIAACPFRSRRKLATNSIRCWSGIAAFRMLLPDMSDGGAEMAGRYGLILTHTHTHTLVSTKIIFKHRTSKVAEGDKQEAGHLPCNTCDRRRGSGERSDRRR